MQVHGGSSAKLLDFGMDPQGVLSFWAEVDRDAAMEDVDLFIVGTGFDVPRYGQYIGSCTVDIYVWHLYRIVPPPGG